MIPARRYLTSAVFLVFMLGKQADCLQWTMPLNESSFTVTCVGKNIAVPWNFELDSGEAVQDIKWFFQAPGSQPELIGVYSSGDFLSKQALSQRVHFLTNAGLDLINLTTADSGRYSVEVDVHNASKTFAKHEMAFQPEVADFFQVSQAPEATYDTTTDSWHVQLKCGLFSSLHQPAGVTWMTPSGVRKDSTSYKDGYLYLQLSNPVEGGTYTCRLPPKSSLTPSHACLPADAPLSKQQPTFTVDKVEVRLTLLEAENRQMKEASLPRVAFFARLAEHKKYVLGLPVIFDQVVTNQGDAYNPKTGEFTAPYNGTYFLVATSLDASIDNNATYGNMDMKVGDSSLCSVRSQWSSNAYDTSSCNAIARLSTGQKVWMRSAVYQTNYFYNRYTTFSGFLISSAD